MCRPNQADIGIECKGLEANRGICPQGKIPTLNEENMEIWRLFTKMHLGLIRDVGYDYKAIEVVFDTYNVPANKRESYFDKCIAISRTKAFQEFANKIRGDRACPLMG